MRSSQPAKLLRIHLSETDRHQDKPLYEVIVARCRELGVAGATVLAGVEGYGETAALHHAHLLRHDRPVVITVIDSAEKIALLLPVVEGLLATGVMALSDVEMIRIQRDKVG